MTDTEEQPIVDDGFVTETWLFAGMRLDSKGKPVYEYYATQDPVDRMLFDHKVSTVGSLYEIPVKRDGERTVARFGNVKYVGPSEDARVSKWMLEHRAAQAELEASRAEARAKREQGELLGTLTLAEARTFQCSDDLHGGEATCADYFTREIDKDGETIFEGRGWASCEEHMAMGLSHLAPDDGSFGMFKIRRITEAEKAEFYEIQDQLKAAAEAKKK